MSVVCPRCQSKRFFYVQSTVEYHSVASLATKDDPIELVALEESIADDTQPQYLWCEDCNCSFNLCGEVEKSDLGVEE